MRMIFGVLSLLMALAVVGFLVKKQMPSITTVKLPEATLPATSAPATPTSAVESASPSAATGINAPMVTSTNVQQQSQLIQQQVQQQLRAATEAAMQQTRPAQDDK